MKSTFRSAVVMSALCIGAAELPLASAAPQVLYAQSDPTLPNFFTVNFPPELGGPQTADIINTKLILRVDPEAGTASVTSWFQRVAPLSLAGISTGNILVKLGGDSSGIFDNDDPGQKNNGVFNTTEAYNVYFAGDLSLFGLQSPFFIPSSSTGLVTYDEKSENTGLISMEWTGVGSIPNPFDPANPFMFTYACSVNSRFLLATSCESVDEMETHCFGGKLRVLVHMLDESQDGGVAAVNVNGEPFLAPIDGALASVVARKRIGDQLVTVEAGADGCQPAQTINCDE